MRLQRRTLFKGFLGSIAAAALAETALKTEAAAPAANVGTGGATLLTPGMPIEQNMLLSHGAPLYVSGTLVAPQPTPAANGDLLDQRFQELFADPYFTYTTAPQNLDSLFIQLLIEKQAEFPLLFNLTREISVHPAVAMAIRRVKTVDDMTVPPNSSHATFERWTPLITHLDYKVGRSHQEMVTFNDGIATADTAQQHADAVYAVIDREGALGVMRRIEWALLHADGNENVEGMTGVNPATVYQGFMAQATRVFDGNITQQEQAMLARDVRMLDHYIAEPLRTDGRLRDMSKVIVLVPPWYAERNGPGVMTTFGYLGIVPSPYLHTDLLAIHNEVGDVSIAQGGPLTRLPLAVVTTRQESLYFLRHTLVAKNLQRILRLPLLPPEDVPTPDLAPPPFQVPAEVRS